MDFLTYTVLAVLITVIGVWWIRKTGRTNAKVNWLVLALVSLFAVSMFLSGCTTPHFTYVGEEYGKDRWQSCEYTDEFMKGDCEDYAIWKRCQLIEAGADPEEIQLIKGMLGDEKHMVLRYQGIYYDNHYQHGRDRYSSFVATEVITADQLEERLKKDNP